jgi:hypothetical protein
VLCWNDNKYASLLPQTQSGYSAAIPTHLSTAPFICDYLNNRLPYLCNHSYLSCLTTQCFAARKETADKGYSADWGIIETSPFTNAFNKRKAVLFSRLSVRPSSLRSRKTLSAQNLKLAKNIGQPCSDTCRYWWACGLRHKSAVAWLLALRVRIPLMAWHFVSCVCCVV